MKELAQKEMHLSQEIKQAKDRVEELYHEMNRRPKPQSEDVPDGGALDHDH